MNYFFDCATKEEAKAKYRKLAKEYHPDNGGNVQIMATITEQYDKFNKEFDLEYNQKKTFNFSSSEQAFKDNIRNAFRQQNANTHYHQYTNINELQRLRDENHMLRGNIYQLESQVTILNRQIRDTSKKLNDTQEELYDCQMEYIRFKDDIIPHPASRIEAFLYFIYFMIKGHP